MDETAAKARLGQQAHALLALARSLQVHSVGERWQGPARRSCEEQLEELERRLRTSARRADVLAHYANTPDVRAFSR